MAVSLLIDKSTNKISDAYLNISGSVEVHRPLPFTFISPIASSSLTNPILNIFESLIIFYNVNVADKYKKYSKLKVDVSLTLSSVPIVNSAGNPINGTAGMGLYCLIDSQEANNTPFVRYPNGTSEANSVLLSLTPIASGSNNYTGTLSYTDYLDISNPALSWPLSIAFQLLVACVGDYKIVTPGSILGSLMLTFTGFNDAQAP